jgi:serine/threonine protein kinase KIN1/2
VTDPKNRATLAEIMNHPWITKGFNGPPENFLPRREPLQLPIDPVVVQGMTGFDFGPAEYITSQLTTVLQSDDYQKAVNQARELSTQHVSSEKKRGFGGFGDFYKRRSSQGSKDALNTPSSEAMGLGLDPVNAFHPLISIYFLVREKQERDRAEANPGALRLPQSPGEKSLPIPDLPAPPAAHTNDAAYEIPGEIATGGRSRPRARTHGEDEVTDAMKRANLGPKPLPTSPTVLTPSALEQEPKKERSAGSILRRLSTRKHKDFNRERPTRQGPPTVNLQPPETVESRRTSPPRKSMSVRRARDSGPPASLSQPQHADLLSPSGPEDNIGGKAAKILGRSTSVSEGTWRRRETRRSGAEASIADHGLTSGSDRSTASIQREPRTRFAETPERDSERPSNTNPRSSAVRTKSLGHARRESIQARRAARQEAVHGAGETDTEGGRGRTPNDDENSAQNVKPVYLKGLFSVSTTSSKSVAFIRSDIIRVLNQLGVEHHEMRGGFVCKHQPSIDLNKVVDNAPSSPEMASNTVQSPGHRRRISFGGLMGVGADRDDSAPSPRNNNRRRAADASFTGSDMSSESIGGRGGVGETSTHVQSELGGSMILDFEIYIVKVPLLSLHGLQFKRLAGGTWQYKNMATKILNELKL